MAETQLEGLVKLSYMQGFSPNWILVELTEKERGLITKWENNSGMYSPGYLGYIDPSKVKKYFSSKCQKEFEGSPKLEICIDFEDRWSEDLGIGRYWFIHNVSEDMKDECIFTSLITISDMDKIDPGDIIEDNSGKIIPITMERIEQEIEKVRKRVEEGHQENFGWVERLAKAGDYDLSEELKELREWGSKRFLEIYSQPENLEKVLKNYEEHRSCESVWEIIEKIPKIKIPEYLKPRFTAVLKDHMDDYQREISQKKREIKEKEKEIEDLETDRDNVLLVIRNMENK